jgi:hypothetical protein
LHVGDPVAYAPAAAEGNYDELVGCVGCNEAGYVGGDAVLEFRERGSVCWSKRVSILDHVHFMMSGTEAYLLLRGRSFPVGR